MSACGVFGVIAFIGYRKGCSFKIFLEGESLCLCKGDLGESLWMSSTEKPPLMLLLAEDEKHATSMKSNVTAAKKYEEKIRVPVAAMLWINGGENDQS